MLEKALISINRMSVEIWMLKAIHSGEISDRNEDQVIGNWKKGDSCYRVANNLAELCSSVLWKVEIVSTGIGSLVLEISKQSFEVRAWFLLTAYNKTREERSDQPELDVENSQPIHTAKK